MSGGCQAGASISLFLLTLNPRIVDQLGEHAETDNLNLEYAGQLEYRFAERWSVAPLAFGEIEDLAQCAGVLFGLTDASADATVRVMFAMEY